MVLLTALVKCAFISTVVWTDSDAVSRYLMTRDLQSDWHIIATGNWPSLYFYLHAALFSLLPEKVSPLVWQILFSAGSTLFVFASLRRIVSYHAAFGGTMLFALQPLLCRLSLQNMSETSALFFVCMAAYFAIKAVQTSRTFLFVLSGLCMAAASGIRYESAIIAAFIAVFLWRNLSFKYAVVFAFSSSLFLMYWFTSNYLIWHQPLHSLEWSAQAITNNTIDNAEALMRRIGWFPVLLLLTIGPAGIVLLIMARKKMAASFAWKKLGWMPIAYLLITVGMCVAGSLLLQSRFVMFTWVLCLPLFAVALESFGEKAIRYAAIWCGVALLGTFIYSTKSLRPIPDWNNAQGEALANTLREWKPAHAAFIHEFYDWEASYNLIYQSGCLNKDLLFKQPDGSLSGGITIESFLQTHTECIALVNQNSRFHHELQASASKTEWTVEEQPTNDTHVWMKMKKKP